MLLSDNTQHDWAASATGTSSGSTNNNPPHDDPSNSLVPVHPLGIKPLGNRFLHRGLTARESAGMFQVLPDEILAHLLEFVGQAGLRALGYTCRFLYAHSVSEELWKTLFLQSDHAKKVQVHWRGTWRSTLLQIPKDKAARIRCSNVFSDVLHRPFMCSHISLNKFASSIPNSNQISRLGDLGYEEFAKKWGDVPFVVTEPIRSWPIFRQWTLEKLLQKYDDVPFRAEAVDWTFATYYKYMTNTEDESPVYLFDRRFAEKMKIKIGREEGAAYWRPAVFGPDLFEVLGLERPAHRWLICGPKGSGSTFHKDPNATSAWNAVIEGTKYWIMFPPSVSPPGVYESEDGSEVTSPLSIAEWLLGFHAEARRLPGCIEGICRAGEMLHVPSGWWHLVVNLESGVAVTQNFVPRSHVAAVLAFLKDRPEQVTGFEKHITDPYALFVQRLSEKHPDLLEEGLQELDRKSRRQKRKWDVAVGSCDEDGGKAGFSFDFVEDDLET